MTLPTFYANDARILDYGASLNAILEVDRVELIEHLEGSCGMSEMCLHCYEEWEIRQMDEEGYILYLESMVLNDAQEEYR